jgi:membrane-bound lytic murein transglycosylase F
LRKRYIIISVLFLVIFTALLILERFYSVKHSAKQLPDLGAIRKRGRLIAVTDFNSIDYFIYKGTPMGFNFELLNSFSDFTGIDLEIIAENDIDRAADMVVSGKADLLATGISGAHTVSKDLLPTAPVDVTRQVLVQRRHMPGDSSATGVEGRKMVADIGDLAGKTVYVEENSSQESMLREIEKKIGENINIVAVPFVPEKIIKLVSDGEIDYCICDENVAAVVATYYNNIDAGLPVSERQELSWGVRRENSDTLAAELNRWISSYRNTSSYAILHSKYYNNSRSSTIVRSDYYSNNTGRVSRYDDIIRKFSATIGWDWRLLASLICQESRFRPDVVSAKGAYGLMQVMPLTGRDFGIDITLSPENNIRAGIMYLRWLNSVFESKVPDEKERLNFVLASYNAGPGHVLDAMRLAGKNGMDPCKWEGNVAVWLLKKSDPQYYKDSVVKNGYFSGRESVKFVTEVLTRFAHYKNIIPGEKARSL